MSQCGEAYTYDESNVHTARWIGTTRRTRSDWEVPINQIHISINATESHKSIVQTTIGNTKLRLVTGDIAEQDTDAVVTAAHWRLNKGTGTDGTIHTKGGPAIYEECRRIGGCPIGDAVITTGGNLSAKSMSTGNSLLNESVKFSP